LLRFEEKRISTIFICRALGTWKRNREIEKENSD